MSIHALCKFVVRDERQYKRKTNVTEKAAISFFPCWYVPSASRSIGYLVCNKLISLSSMNI